MCGFLLGLFYLVSRRPICTRAPRPLLPTIASPPRPPSTFGSYMELLGEHHEAATGKLLRSPSTMFSKALELMKVDLADRATLYNFRRARAPWTNALIDFLWWPPSVWPKNAGFPGCDDQVLR